MKRDYLPVFTVIVVGMGWVYTGLDEEVAEDTFENYKQQIQSGECSLDGVMLYEQNELIKSFLPKNEMSEEEGMKLAVRA
jgi:hypothetical protein